jgi:hypothetical protein
MAITIAWGDSYDGFDAAGNTTDSAVNTTGYTHVLAFAGSDTPASTITFSTASQVPAWTYLTQRSQSNATARMAYGAIASPGAGYTLTAVHSGSPTFRNVGFWLIDADSGSIALVDDDYAVAASGASVSTPALSNAGGNSVVGGMCVTIDGASTGNTEGSGWTENADQSDGFGIRVIAAMRGPETTTSITPAYTLANGAIPWVALAAIFREATAGGTTPKLATHQYRMRRVA